MKCRCGGELINTQCSIEFFDIDFGMRDCLKCSKCKAEYLDDKVIQEIEDKLKNVDTFHNSV